LQRIAALRGGGREAWPRHDGANLYQPVAQGLIPNRFARVVLEPAVHREVGTAPLDSGDIGLAILIGPARRLTGAHAVDVLGRHPHAGPFNSANIEHHENGTRCHLARAVVPLRRGLGEYLQ